MFFARAQAADQLAPGETKAVPLDRLGEIRRGAEDPLAQIRRQWAREIRRGFEPFIGVGGLGAADVHAAILGGLARGAVDDLGSGCMAAETLRKPRPGAGDFA